MSQRIIISFIILLFCGSLHAADTILVKKDPRLDVLSVKQLQANQRSAMMTPNGLYKGYRIQVISTSKRDDAFAKRSELLSRFPDQKVYVIFQSPSFKVRIGNFLKKEDAEKFKAQLNKLYPQGVYIVEDGIEYTLKEDEDIINQ
ncbi:MAG: SPOR domain-containing protein [Bacteroidota bacterium]